MKGENILLPFLREGWDGFYQIPLIPLYKGGNDSFLYQKEGRLARRGYALRGSVAKSEDPTGEPHLLPSGEKDIPFTPFSPLPDGERSG